MKATVNEESGSKKKQKQKNYRTCIKTEVNEGKLF